MQESTIVFDVETYRNYCLIVFLRIEDNTYWLWDKWNDQPLNSHQIYLDMKATYVGFNSKNYDRLLLTGMIEGWSNGKLKDLSDKIISGEQKPWSFEREHGCRLVQMDHIDVIDVLPLIASLKVYGARIGCKKLQELPIPPDSIIEHQDINTIRRYCINDCMVTAELYKKVKPQITLREQLSKAYGMDLRSKSDPQIAETVISSEYRIRQGYKIDRPSSKEWANKSVYYNPPPFVTFQTQDMKRLLTDIQSIEFKVGKTGSIDLPKYLKDQIVKLGSTSYQMGIGGLHSIDKPGSFYTDEAKKLQDIDVTSYYPQIILNAGYYPTHIGPVFLEIYRDLVNKRVSAKGRGDKVTADTLKIAVNGTFGKLGNKYSAVYAPDLMLHVTLTGQLCLLMLIEMIPHEVVSANTDGVLVSYDSWQKGFIQTVVESWERFTGFKMEWSPYASFHRRDVNNYLGIKQNGKTKTKGIFSPPDLSKNPVNPIVIEAVRNHFLNGAKVKDTIRACQEPAKFLTLRTVRGGAVKDDLPIGKCVRWYYSRESGTAIHYQSNGNKVPNSNEGVPMMDIPDTLPSDIDYQRYIYEAADLIKLIS